MPCAFTGAFRSEVSIATALLTSLKGYPQFSGLSESDKLNDKDTFPLFGRLVPSNDNSAGPLLDFLTSQFGLEHVAVVHTDDIRGISFLDAFRREAQGRVTLRTVGFPDATTNFTATVQELKATGYRFIVGIVRALHPPPLMEEAQRQGIAGDGLHNWLFTTQPQTSDLPVTAARGAQAFESVGLLPGVGRHDEFLSAWLEIKRDAEDLDYLLTKMPQYPNEPDFRLVVASDLSESTDYWASLSPKLYETTIALGLAACAVRSNGTTLDGPSHYQATVDHSFVGVSGTVELDPTTGSRKPQSQLYVIQNFVAVPVNGSDELALDSVQTHYFNREWIQQQPIVFSDGTTNIPDDLPPAEIQYNYIGTTLRVIGGIFSGIVIALSIACSLWTHRYQNVHVVRASQPIFLHFICLGTFLMGVSIIPLSIDQEIAKPGPVNAACMSFPWLFALGWCVAFSALYVKTRRVNRIMSNPRLRRITITAKDAILPMLIMLALNLAILIVWTVYSPMTWEISATAYDMFDRAVEFQGSCGSDHQIAFVVPMVILNVGALGFALQQAYVARKISTEYAESEWIARCMVIILVIAFIGVPVLILANDNSRAFFFVLAAILFIVCMSLLCVIFGPKMAHHHKKPDQRASTGRRRSSFSVYNAEALFGEGSTRAMSLNADASDTFGVAVTDHPQMRSYLSEQVNRLRSENAALKVRLAVYEEGDEEDSGHSDNYDHSGPAEKTNPDEEEQQNNEKADDQD